MWFDFSSDDGHGGHDGLGGVRNDVRGGRDGRDDDRRPERILWLSNAMVCALRMVCAAQFPLVVCGRQVL